MTLVCIQHVYILSKRPSNRQHYGIGTVSTIFHLLVITLAPAQNSDIVFSVPVSLN